VSLNDTSGGTFSENDISKFVSYHIKEIRTVSPYGETYSLRREKYNSVDPALEKHYNSYVKIAKIEADSYALQGYNEYEADKLWRQKLHELAHDWLLKNAQNYGCVYSVERNE